MFKIKGMGLISFLMVLFLIGCGVYLALMIAPPYYDHYAIEDALEAVAKDPNVTIMSKAKLADALSRRLEVNNIRGFNTTNIELVEANKKNYLVLAYEVRKHLVSNVDVILTFDSRVVVE